jgi:hypothetical protein
VTRRASLPGADELFRSTTEPNSPRAPEQLVPERAPEIAEPVNPRETSDPQATQPPGSVAGEIQPQLQRAAEQRSPKHGQKVTFYCTDEELTRLERARLTLRADHRLACDRSRLVRAALAEVLGEFESEGARSRLVRRLKDAEPH